MRERILYINYYCLLAFHLGGRKLYYKRRKDLYWTSIVVEYYVTVRKWHTIRVKSVEVKKECQDTSNISTQGATDVSVHRYPPPINPLAVNELTSPGHHGKGFEDDDQDDTD